MMNYLRVYPMGKMQVKYSWNANRHTTLLTKFKDVMSGLNDLFQVNVKIGDSLGHLEDGRTFSYNDMDFSQYAISICQKNIVNKDVEYKNKWKVDCRYCLRLFRFYIHNLETYTCNRPIGN